ncbi:MAG: hypothetical protein QXX56_03740 [Candidatus Bathyarchaeia archaeon]
MLLKNYSIEGIKAIVEMNVIPSMYLHHLLDPDMRQIYYFWDGVYYRLQTRFINGSCIALLSGKGCILGDYRPLICKVWPFWWKRRADLSSGDFQIEIDGDCTMATYWKMPVEEILREIGYSERTIKQDLLALNRALREHGKMLREASKKRIPPEKILDWIVNSISNF